MNDLPSFSALEKPEDVPGRHPSHLHSLRLSGAGGKAVHVNTIYPVLENPGGEPLWKTDEDGAAGPIEMPATYGNLGIFT